MIQFAIEKENVITTCLCEKSESKPITRFLRYLLHELVADEKHPHRWITNQTLSIRCQDCGDHMPMAEYFERVREIQDNIVNKE